MADIEVGGLVSEFTHSRSAIAWQFDKDVCRNVVGLNHPGLWDC
jgi:hypothetical protein